MISRSLKNIYVSYSKPGAPWGSLAPAMVLPARFTSAKLLHCFLSSRPHFHFLRKEYLPKKTWCGALYLHPKMGRITKRTAYHFQLLCRTLPSEKEKSVRESVINSSRVTSHLGWDGVPAKLQGVCASLTSCFEPSLNCRSKDSRVASYSWWEGKETACNTPVPNTAEALQLLNTRGLEHRKAKLWGGGAGYDILARVNKDSEDSLFRGIFLIQGSSCPCFKQHMNLNSGWYQTLPPNHAGYPDRSILCLTYSSLWYLLCLWF